MPEVGSKNVQLLPIDLAVRKKIDATQLVEHPARVEQSSRDEDVRHIDGIRDGPQENQRSQPQERAGRSRFERKDQHYQPEYIGSCDR